MRVPLSRSVPGTYARGVSSVDVKFELVSRLDRLNQAVLYKLEGLSEYDLRRPMTLTATNLLGVTMHLASLQSEYFGETFGRPFPRASEFYFLTDEDEDPHGDLWVRPEYSSTWLMGLYRATWEHAQETVAVTELDSIGRIPTPPYAEMTLAAMLVHMVQETARHVGHMDVVRELIDGAVGRFAADPNITDGYDWAAYRARVEAAAREAENPSGS
jgi:hypothetical protein